MTTDKTRDELFAEYFEDREGSAKVAEHAYRQGWKDRATYTVVPSTIPSPISDQAAAQEAFELAWHRYDIYPTQYRDDGEINAYSDPVKEKAWRVFRYCATAPTTGSAPEINQCDGCRVNAPLTERGNHAMPDGGFMACTKDRYAVPASPIVIRPVEFESALAELVNKIDTSLDSGDLLIDARRASAALDAILTKAARSTVPTGSAPALCAICKGYGRYQDGDSGTESDGYAPNIVECDCTPEERIAASPAASVLPIQRYAVFETQDGRGPHIVEEPCNTGKWVKYADLAAYSPAVSLDVQNVLCNVTQILDTVKMEWSATNSWSEWDQSVRDSISAILAASTGGDKS